MERLCQGLFKSFFKWPWKDFHPMHLVLQKTSDFKAKIKVRRKSIDDSRPRSALSTRSSSQGSSRASSQGSDILPPRVSCCGSGSSIHPLEDDCTPDLSYQSSTDLNDRNFTVLVEIKSVDSIPSLKTAQMQLISYAVALSFSDLVDEGTEQFVLLVILPQRFHVGTFHPKKQKNRNVKFNMFEIFSDGQLSMASLLSFFAALDKALAKFVK